MCWSVAKVGWSVAKVASVGCDGYESGVWRLQQLLWSFAKVCGIFTNFFFFFQLICELMVIHKGKPIKEDYLFPDSISSKILQGIGY
jgi:hypothetical protein